MRGRCELHWGVLVAEPTDQQPTYEPLAGAMPAGRYPHVLDYLLTTPWAIEPSKLSAIVDVVVHRAFVGALPRERVEAAMAEKRTSPVVFATAAGDLLPAAEMTGAATSRPPSGARNVTAVLPIYGTLLPRASQMDEDSGLVSVNSLRATFRALVADPEVAAILLDLDTPGGSVGFIQEFGAEIRAARAKKPIGAVANPNSASAGYWLMTQATPGLQYVSPSGQIGSVGVITAHEDISRELEQKGVAVSLITSSKAPFKAEGNPYEPLGSAARAEAQSRVDSYHADFRRAVAAGRGVSVDVVDEQFGGGRVFRAADAVARQMADHVGTFEDALTAVLSAASERSSARTPRAAHDNQRESRAAQPSRIDVDALGAALAAGIQRKD